MKNLALAILALAFSWMASASAQASPPANVNACNLSFVYDASTSGATLIATAGANEQIYVCGGVITGGGTATVALEYGTKVTNPCDTGTTKITPAFSLVAQTVVPFNSVYWNGLKLVPAGNQLCIATSAGVAIQAIIFYGTTP